MKKIILSLCLFFTLSCVGYSQTLSNVNLAKIRRLVTSAIQDSTGAHGGYTKPQINAIFQALEDWYNTNPGSTTGSGKSQLNSVVSTEATNQSLTLTALQKKIIISVWLMNKIEEELGIKLLR